MGGTGAKYALAVGGGSTFKPSHPRLRAQLQDHTQGQFLLGHPDVSKNSCLCCTKLHLLPGSLLLHTLLPVRKLDYRKNTALVLLLLL